MMMVVYCIRESSTLYVCLCSQSLVVGWYGMLVKLEKKGDGQQQCAGLYTDLLYPSDTHVGMSVAVIHRHGDLAP